MKRKFTLFFALLLALLLAVTVASCKEKAVTATDFTIDASGVTTTVKVGDKIDVSALTATASFSDESTTELTANDLTYYAGETKLAGTTFGNLTAAPGTVEITVKYEGFEKTLTFTVEDLVVTAFTIDDSKVNKTVQIDDVIAVNKLKATVTFDNGKAEVLTASDLAFYNGETKLEGTIFDDLTDEAGTVTITVKYTYKSSAFEENIIFTVEDLVATELTLNDTDVVKTVKVGDKINVGGLTATVKYDNNSKKLLNADDLSFYIGDTLLEGQIFEGKTTAAGTVTITVKYLTFEKTLVFTVEEKVAQSIELNTSGLETAVKVKNNIDVGNLKATVTFDDGSTETLNATALAFYNGTTPLEGTHFSGLTDTAGTVTITVKYLTFEKTVTFTVLEKNPISLALNLSDVKTVVKVGDAINVGALSATVTYDNGTTGDLAATALAFYNGTELLEGTSFADLTDTTGNVTITVKYTFNGETVFNDLIVTVEEKHPVSFEINTDNVTTDLLVNETIDISGLTAVVTFDTGSPENLTAGELSFYDAAGPLEGTSWAGLTSAGDVTIIVKYMDYTKTVVFTFEELSATELVLDTADMETTVKIGGDINFEGLAATATMNDAGNTEKALETKDLTFYIGEEKLTLKNNKISGYTTVVGTVTIRAEYRGASKTFTVTVEDLVANGFTIDDSKLTKTVKVGDVLNVGSLKATVSYDNNTSDTVNLTGLKFYNGETLLSGTIFDGLTSAAGTVTITVKYLTFERTITFTVENLVPTVFEIDDSKVNKDLKVGDAINLSALTATVTYDNGTSDILSANQLSFYLGETPRIGTIFKGLTDEAGTITITIKYLTFEKTVTVTVADLVAQTLVLNTDGVPAAVVDEKADFSDITAEVTFDNGTVKTLTVKDLTFYHGSTKLTLDSNYKVSGITAAEENVIIKAEYKEASANFTVTVVSKEIDPELYEFTSLSLPSSETTRRSNASSSVFLDKSADSEARIVGDDNPFYFLPLLKVYSYTAQKGLELNSYSTVSTIKVKNGATLTTIEDTDEKTTKFYSGETLIVTSYYAEGKYQFTSNAIGNTYVISVIPRAFAGDWDDTDTRSITVTIVDGYNVYDAKDLAIFDNTTSKGWSADSNANGGWAKDPNVWADIREEKGFSVEMSNATKAIIFQKDIKITPDDLPDSYVGTIQRDLVYYTYGVDENEDGKPDVDTEVGTIKGAKRLTHDDNGNMFLYERWSDNDFTFYGNFYTLDASEIPLVSAFDEVAVETDEFGNHLIISNYGGDTSNASLFRFGSKDGAYKPNLDDPTRATYSFNNLNVVGNANTEQWVMCAENDKDCKDPKAVNAGGFIFLKAADCNLESNNLSINRCFIGYLLEDNVKATANYAKVTASYQDAAFLWGGCEMTFDNGYLRNAGGPLFILQHVKPDQAADPAKYYNSRVPKLTVTDSVVENYVTGNEMWFYSMAATGMIPTIKAGSNAFVDGYTGGTKTTLKNVGSRENCLNLICLSMSNGNNASALESPLPQGYCTIEKDGRSYVLDRTEDSLIRTKNAAWGGVELIATGTVILNLEETLVSGMYFMPTASSFQYVGANESGFLTQLSTADFITFSNGGMSLILGLSNK